MEKQEEQTTKNSEVPQETKGVSPVIPPRYTDTPPIISYGTLETRIVGLLGKGLGVKRMARLLGVSPSNVTRAIASLRRKGFKIGLGGECPNIGETLKGFSVPQETKGVSVASWGTINAPPPRFIKPLLPLEPKGFFVSASRAHNIKLKFPIRQGVIRDLQGWKEVRLRYNSQWHRREGELYYIYTGKSILIEFPAVTVRDAEEYMRVIKETGEVLAKEIETKYNILLTRPSFSQQVVSQHHALVNDPFAKWLQSKGVTFSSGLFDVDSSTGREELEFTDRETATADFTKYNEFIKDVVTNPDQLKLSDLKSNIQVIEENLAQATQLLKQTIQTQEITLKMVEMLYKEKQQPKLEEQPPLGKPSYFN